MFRQIVSKMKKAATFLQYPIIQYIPISITTLAQSTNWPNPYNQASPQLFLFQDREALQSTLSRFQIAAGQSVPDGELYIVCLNFNTELVLFRYLTCKIIGRSRVGSYHVFSVTKKYFPRRSLHFGMYENDGRKLRSVNYEVF